MPLHDGQKRFFTHSTRKINVLVPANRWGKSITVAIKHIHACFYKIGVGRGDREGWARTGYLTANLAPHSEALMPVFQAVREIMTSSFAIPQEDGSFKNNECQIGWRLDEGHIRTTAPISIPFTNNSEIIFRSTGEDKGTSIQGKKIGYISYDEGGRSNHLELELKNNIIPRLGDYNGKLDIVSTPSIDSRSLVYHSDLFDLGQAGGEEVTEKGNFSVYSQSGSITENIFFLRNNPSYVDDTLALYAGDPIVEQVLYGKFIFAGGNLFPTEDVKAARDSSLNLGVPYEKDHQYVVGIDTAIGEDECVYTVLDVTSKPFRVVRQMSAKGTSKSPQIHMADLIGLVNSYKVGSNVRIVLEAWNEGSVRFYYDMPMSLQVITKIWGSWPGLVNRVDPLATGRRTSIAKKADILIALRKLLAVGELRIPNEPVLVKQLSTYREKDKDLQTDRVISLCLAAWYATDGAPVKSVAVEVYW